MSALQTAKHGDVLEAYGVKWIVIGFSRHPAVLLARTDCIELPIEERTHVSVIADSPWAANWLPADEVEERREYERLRLKFEGV